jgi:hypothetical protein
MKRCPQCNRTYSDDSFSFCLADGTLLSAPFDSEKTLALQTSPRTSGKRKQSQRDFMRELVMRFGIDEERVVREYAEAEKRGEVERKRNSSNYTAEQYARALWNDAVKKGWISGL